ncbi:hypothetical protein PA905_05470 [Planktothrix agardhii CCAP 1459/11A]|uniref:Ribosome biogenesis GTPase A n=1 Tax=Planktothrix agardhii CCAP 1459/11A TaxID=282420 RepID=A0A4P5ZA08_PLAAG|nr:ribosome biogenesis GTPase YlqF [Planktothrix agardhii]GDZ92850.1 hypothetical protein PA905_05470 [Planktothrix agardhii CCAP 1459/11A]CAD5934908.1 DAR GTPase 3, chloroplastic [Planktothrix rubescens]
MSIQWYPGHIAKAERTLQEQLKRVDVILEVRDSRIPLTTHHPNVPQWVGSKMKVLVINRMDMIPSHIQKQWEEWFEEQGETAYFTNSRLGNGVDAVAKAAQAAGSQINEKRAGRGMLPRPVRAAVIGFPNVGKSALINRLLNRRIVDSARRAGVTRHLKWVRISETLELLDAPGVIPTKIRKEEDALKLAICEDIGEASYENLQVATVLIELLQDFNLQHLLVSRYQLEFTALSGDIYLQELAEYKHKGDIERTARQMLNDFRKGLLGNIALELPPNS